MASAARKDLKSAMAARDLFRSAIEQLPKERTYGTNTERDVMRLPMFLLDAKIALAGGDVLQAIGHLKEAVAAEDALAYNEPPDWYYPPSREALGGVLLQAGRHSEAEAVFRGRTYRAPVQSGVEQGRQAASCRGPVLITLRVFRWT
jgi:hypothetical protein